MSEQYQLTISDYIEIAKRRWPYAAGAFLSIFLVAVLGALLWPKSYESTGTILIETQQIPSDLIRSTVTSYADERIQIIQQIVMTRENLLRIVRKFNLFADNIDRLTLSEQVKLMQEKISLTKVAGNSARATRNVQTTIAFKLGFEDESPFLANAVANELVTLFLNENVKNRTERATETTEFLSGAAVQLKRTVETMEAEIAQFKQEHSDALPEHLDLHLKMLERTEASIGNVERSIRSAKDEYRFLEVEKSAVISGISNSSGSITYSPAQKLAAAEAELDRLKARYSVAHPDVRRQQSLVEQLKEELGVTEGSQGSSNAAPRNFDVSRIEARMASVSKTIASLKTQLIQLSEKREELEKNIIRTPQVERTLMTMERDYDNTLKKYKEIQGKEMEAKIAENLEADKKAERFTLIEPPIMPDAPSKPDQVKIITIGFLLALVGGVGLVVLLETMNQRVRSVDALTLLVSERPLVVVPYITIEEEHQQRKRIYKLILVAAVVSSVLVLAAVHFFYTPLDLLFLKVKSRYF